MSKSSLRTLHCPSCHAPLEVDIAQPVVKCEYCGSMVEVPPSLRDQPRAKPKPPKPDPRPVAPPKPTVTRQPVVRSQSGSSGCTVFLLFFLCLGGFLVAVMFMQNQQGIPNPLSDVLPSLITLASDGYLLAPESGRDTNQADVLAVTYKGETYDLAYLDNTTEKVRWENGDFSEYPSLLQIQANDQFVYVVHQTNLIAYDRAEGNVVWQATLSDKLAGDISLQIYPTTLIALTADGLMQAYDNNTGELVWSLRLEETPRELYRVVDQVGLMDTVDDITTFLLFDPATGFPQRQIQPRGRNEPFGDDSPQYPSTYDPVYQDATGQYLYFFMGFFEPGTVQKWDGTTGEMVWEVTGPVDEILPPYDQFPLFVHDRVYIGNGNNLSVIDETTQSWRPLTNSADYTLRPVTEQNGVVLVLAERTRGTTRQELWGVDMMTGVVRWQYVPAAANYLEPDEYEAVSSDSGYWTILWPDSASNSDSALIFQIFSEPDHVILERLTLTDGTRSDLGTTELGEISGSTIYRDMGNYRNVNWLMIERKLYALDITAGTLTRRWP
jgi:outer membrane protein assembly factor BamB